MIQKLTILVLLIFLFSSCEKVEKIEDVGDIQPKLIVTSVAKAGTPLYFMVNKSLSALDNARMKPVTNALVKVFKSGVLIDTAILTGEFYVCDQLYPNYGEEFSVEVSAPGMATVYSSTKVTEQSPINDMTLKVVNRNWDSGQHWFTATFESAKLRITFKDKAGEKNFYVLMLKEIWSSSGIVGERNISWNCNRPGVEALMDYNNYDYVVQYYFEDAGSDGQEIAVEFETSYPYNITRNNNDSIQAIRCELHTVTEDYHKYLYTMTQAGINQYNPFQEPVQIYSNVRNGYGVFGSDAISAAMVPFK